MRKRRRTGVVKMKTLKQKTRGREIDREDRSRGEEGKGRRAEGM